ncbi:MAG: preprotein translocase subunit SecA [Clostridiales bacterium]|jgi:preprotein translocase subunit SecA|nr:preprotein translocase subunit SecA [Clostridiales bacterium]MDN5282213.1 preprotein translocase subunit SecA [Candidatus Ozemobacter sp.]
MFDWLFKLIRFFIPDFNTRELNRLDNILEEVNELEDYYKSLSDEELAGMTQKFRQRLFKGETLEDIRSEAFATVRETARRVLNMRHYDVQIIGGCALHEGRIVEMKTGEGKTLVATLPLYLNALEINPEWEKLAREQGVTEFVPLTDKNGLKVPVGRGAQLITVNDYLARRDSEWMGKVFKFLGMTVGLNIHGLTPEEKRAAYASDITYGTNNEFGFDYLRDNMALSLADCSQRSDYNFAIVDEVDSILIDEARTPLIISGPAEKATSLYFVFAKIAKEVVKPELDYVVDEKHHGISITESGIAKVEKALGIENLYDNNNMDHVHHLQNALKAKHFFHRDKEYIVRPREDGRGPEVVIVDEFTGRLMFGRRYSDGLHQAIEAKEGVTIQQENQTLASITFQNYFRLYRKLSGMTGTAETEAKEFKEIYKCEVVVVPSNKPCIRNDFSDVIFKTVEEKFEAIVENIIEIHERKQPVLVGTISIEKSELIAELLRRRGVKCEVLNAKYHEREAEIVAQAGREGAITIATNMAGRGTDILLGGNPEMLAKQEVDDEDSPEYQAALEKYRKVCEAEKQRVLDAGGLFIIGTERHESRRIDNQLRGRAGRQGDPGASQFYLSLEDDLMRLFGSVNISGWMEKLGWERGEPIEHPWISRSIESAQRKVEAYHFDVRKQVLKYDDVMNQQRTVIYQERRKALEQDQIHEDVLTMIEEIIQNLIETDLNPAMDPDDYDYNALADNVKKIFPIEVEGGDQRNGKPGQLCTYSREELFAELKRRILEKLDQKRLELGDEDFYQMEKFLLLQIVDGKWKDHLQNMDNLQDGIHLRSWGQRDPLVEYKIEGFQMFQNMIEGIKEDVLYYLYRISYSRAEEKEIVEKHEQEVYYNRGDEENAPQKPVRADESTVGRNDPCPCGSGKKYKKCCGR